MLRRTRPAAGTLAIFAILAVAGIGEPDRSLLKLGDALPPLSGQTVTGKPLELPKAASGKVAMVIVSFSRSGGRDAQNWAQQISKDAPNLPIFTAIFLESVPRIFRSFAVSGIRSAMPPLMLDRTLLLYQQQSSWQQRLHVTDTSYACVLVLDQFGHIRWISSGPFADSTYQRLKKELWP